MNRHENKSAASVAVISLSSKLLTLFARTMYLAIFGMASPLLNAYNYALQVPNVLFNCVGTALHTVMIPIYTSLLAEDKKDDTIFAIIFDWFMDVVLSIYIFEVACPVVPDEVIVFIIFSFFVLSISNSLKIRTGINGKS